MLSLAVAILINWRYWLSLWREFWIPQGWSALATGMSESNGRCCQDGSGAASTYRPTLHGFCGVWTTFQARCLRDWRQKSVMRDDCTICSGWSSLRAEMELLILGQRSNIEMEYHDTADSVSCCSFYLLSGHRWISFKSTVCSDIVKQGGGVGDWEGRDAIILDWSLEIFGTETVRVWGPAIPPVSGVLWTDLATVTDIGIVGVWSSARFMRSVEILYLWASHGHLLEHWCEIA